VIDDPEQEAFRRALRERTRRATELVDDDDWQPRPPPPPPPRRKPGPPPSPNPSANALAARLYRERKAAERQMAQVRHLPSDDHPRSARPPVLR